MIKQYSNEIGFTLVEIVIVIAIVGFLAAATVVTLKPQEIMANGRNTRRIDDVQGLNTSIGQWLAREGLQELDPFGTLGLTAVGVDAITPDDGDISTEGIAATTVGVLVSNYYLPDIPVDPSGSGEYRVGVDDLASPQHVLVCTDQIEFTSAYTAATYPSGIFCLSN